MSLYENYEVLMPLADEELKQIPGPVFDIVGLRMERDYDNRYDHFKMDFVGEPSAITMQGGITDKGHMFYISRNHEYDPLHWSNHGVIDDPRAYYVALADMHDNDGNYDGNWGATYVIRAENIYNSPRSPGQPMTSIYLSNNPLEQAPAAATEQYPADTIARHLAERAIRLATDDWWANKPRIVLSSHMTRLYLPEQRPETFHSWSEIDRRLCKYGPRIAQMLLKESVELAVAS